MKKRLPAKITGIDVYHTTTRNGGRRRLSECNNFSWYKSFAMMYTYQTCARSITSNIQDIDGVRPIISPDARQSFLLSSSTVLRFSIQTASTGPSKMIHFRAFDSDVDSSLNEKENEGEIWRITTK